MRLTGSRNHWVIVATIALLATAPSITSAQSYDGTGVVPTGLLLRQLDGVKRVLMIGAHPDDEDTALLTVLARTMGAQTAYLSLTRGDGGQNLIGPELWEGLGVIRTGELEAARELDGGEQYFTRAFDFGYSKTAEETLRFWPHEEVLRDAVWIIRRFRPHVIVSVWSGTPRDGHGHHQASGILSREAFEAAGDPERFTEQFELGVEPWAPAKLYMSSRRRSAGTSGQAEVVLPAGENDPLLGRSALQLSAESRSQHRSQDMGSSQPMGPRNAGAFFIAGNVDGSPNEMFDGVDTTLVGLTEGMQAPVAAEVRGHLEAYRADIAAARDGLGLDPTTIVPHLASAVRHLERAREAAPARTTEFDQVLTHKLMTATRAVFAAAGIVLDVRSVDDLLVPGQTVEVRAQLWNGGPYSLGIPRNSFLASPQWDVREVDVDGLAEDGSVAPQSLATWRYEVTLPEDQAPTRQYFLAEERDGAFYRWPDSPGIWGLPRNQPAAAGAFAFAIFDDGEALGGQLNSTVFWRYVGVDQAKGQYEKPVLVVPAVSLAVSPSALVWPDSRSEAQTVTVTVGSEVAAGASGTVVLNVPEGWRSSPSSQPFELGSAGVERTVSFEVAPTGTLVPGEHHLRAVVTTDDGQVYTEGFSLIDYEHVPRTALYRDAAASVTVVPVRTTEGLRVGYIMGTGDDGPLAISQMGADVELLSEDQVRGGDFEGYDALVIGVRAYEARPDVRAVNEQILDFARAGGTVVVQYQQFQFSRGGYAPNGFAIGRGRVSDETAEITVLEPDAPVFTTPNRITSADFEGWVQERGLYFASEWGDEYTPLIEANDPGEEPLRGSLLVTQLGDGVYAYASLSFFRQWAGRVPGAYRLFANLISLDADDWAEFVSSR